MFTPTGNRRLNELVGFVCLTASAILLLSLLSYSPIDASFNVAGPAEVRAGSAARNWIGPFGAHVSDLVFQGFGFAAFLLPAGLALFGVRWFRSRPISAPVVKACGFLLLLLSAAALCALTGVPGVRSLLPAGGLAGTLMANMLRAAFNPLGASLVAISSAFVALFLTTRFSFTSAAAWVGSPVAGWQPFAPLKAKWTAWRAAQEEARQRRRLAQIRVNGRPPIIAKSTGKTGAASAQATLPAEDRPGPNQIVLREEKLKAAAAQGLAAAASAAASAIGAKLPAVARTVERTAGPMVVPPPSAAVAAATPASKAGPQPRIAKSATGYRLPSPDLLHRPVRSEQMDEGDLKERARAIEAKCREFDVGGHITQINPGPVVTTFEFKPEAGIKYSRITGLADDLCLALQAESILIERIPGKSTVGIEAPNPHRETIALREVIECPDFVNSPSKLTLGMGKDLIGRLRVSNLAEMPHLLIAGSTGTGKSVFLNSLIVSMLYKATPDELKLVLVDPKRLELGLYEEIPHLLAPVVTDPKVASNVLRNATREMERRLKLLAQRGVRNIDQYNRQFQKQESLSLFDDLDGEEHKPLPYIVIVIDELADLMMVDTNNVEEAITRLAQMARAVGIHLILATQRPSVDVITGLIKANFPARISFRVASKVDSRTILDANGSEALLGRGDMLYLPAGSSRLHRIHGPLVTEDEISGLCDFWREQAKAVYNEELLRPPKEDKEEDESESGAEGERGDASGDDEVDDDLYQDAVRVVLEAGRASTSTLQRRLRIGYGRAARLIDLMEKDGIVGPADGTRPREVLKKKDWMREFDESLH
ncbi:MAG TPA: DNA translocase FtsK [Candidatus Acidoferrales bacterium]|nr:DNA translocase FtsK [Candidatus Acidoferrales bacterium]